MSNRKIEINLIKILFAPREIMPGGGIKGTVGTLSYDCSDLPEEIKTKLQELIIDAYIKEA